MTLIGSELTICAATTYAKESRRSRRNVLLPKTSISAENCSSIIFSDFCNLVRSIWRSNWTQAELASVWINENDQAPQFTLEQLKTRLKRNQRRHIPAIRVVALSTVHHDANNNISPFSELLFSSHLISSHMTSSYPPFFLAISCLKRRRTKEGSAQLVVI